VRRRVREGKIVQCKAVQWGGLVEYSDVQVLSHKSRKGTYYWQVPSLCLGTLASTVHCRSR